MRKLPLVGVLVVQTALVFGGVIGGKDQSGGRLAIQCPVGTAKVASKASECFDDVPKLEHAKHALIQLGFEPRAAKAAAEAARLRTRTAGEATTSRLHSARLGRP